MSATIHLLALNEASYNPPRKVEQRAMLPPKRCVLSLNQTCSDPPWFAKVITQAKQTMINWMSHLPDNVYTNLYPFPTVYVIFEAWLSAHFDLRNAFDESKSIPCFCNNVVCVYFYNELKKHEGSIWHKQTHTTSVNNVIKEVLQTVLSFFFFLNGTRWKRAIPQFWPAKLAE